MEDNPLRPTDIQAGVLNCFDSQFRCHGCSICISDDLTAAQIHHGSQAGPPLFLYMDIGNIRAPFLVDGFYFEVTLQDIFLIIRDSPMIGMMVVSLYYNRASLLWSSTKLDNLITPPPIFF